MRIWCVDYPEWGKTPFLYILNFWDLQLSGFGDTWVSEDWNEDCWSGSVSISKWTSSLWLEDWHDRMYTSSLFLIEYSRLILVFSNSDS